MHACPVRPTVVKGYMTVVIVLMSISFTPASMSASSIDHTYPGREGVEGTRSLRTLLRTLRLSVTKIVCTKRGRRSNICMSLVSHSSPR